MDKKKIRQPITLILSKDTLPEWQDLRCVCCTRKIANINQELKYLSFEEGISPAESCGIPLIEHKCRGCEAVYKILQQQ